MKKKAGKSATANVFISNPTLWRIAIPKMFTKSEHQLFLKLCAPASGVLLKSKSKQIEMSVKHDVSYLKLLAAVEAGQKKLTGLQKQCDTLCFSSLLDQSSFVNCADNNYNNEDNGDLADGFML